MLNGNCCNKFLYIYRTARYLCSSVRFAPETNVSGVFLLSKKIVIQQYLSRFGFTCPSRGNDSMVFCLVLFNGKSYLFYVSRFYEKGHTAG